MIRLGSGSVAEEVAIPYAAGATLADVAAAINAALKGAANDYSGTSYGGWAASEADGRIVLTSNTYNAPFTEIDVVSGCDIIRTPEDRHYQTTLTGLFAGSFDYLRRNNGFQSSDAGCNAEKFLQYHSVNGTDTTGIKPGSSTIIRESAFTEAANPALVAAYPTYRDYLFGEHLLQYPCAYGAVLRDGKSTTAKLGGLRFVDIRGENAPCYPAAAAALGYGVTVEGAATGLEAGAWWLPSVEEMYLLMRDRVSGPDAAERDPVNRTLGRLGKTSCYGSGYYPRTSCEYNYGLAFFYHGYMGTLCHDPKYDTVPVRPVSIL